MGLTIHYKLSTRRRLDLAGVRKLVEQLRTAALKIGARDVGDLFRVGPDFTWAYHYPPHPRTWRDLLPPLEGWLFNVDPGEGCESVMLGLCRYQNVPGWRLDAFCKTHYASAHGWEHFRDCHRRVIKLLRACAKAGLQVKADDEGFLWETGSIQRLRQAIAEYDQTLAAVGGALKDAFGSEQLSAPILSHPDFERLEAKGVARHGRRLPAIVAATGRVLGEAGKG